jgi:hypothetical protein
VLGLSGLRLSQHEKLKCAFCRKQSDPAFKSNGFEFEMIMGQDQQRVIVQYLA